MGLIKRVRQWLGIDKEPPEDLQRWRKSVEEARKICQAMEKEAPKELAPPTEACLRTLELEEFAQGKPLSQERIAHISECRRCSVLLPEALLDEEHIKLLVARTMAAIRKSL